MTVLVTGGAGFIGSHTTLRLIESGHKVLVIDNLSNSSIKSLSRVSDFLSKQIEFVNVDIRDKAALKMVFENNNIKSVIHFAGLKSVNESLKKPRLYYENNVLGSLNLFSVMDEFHVKNLVFSSSATVYGGKNISPIKESLAVMDVVNPYGRTKLIIEEILKDISVSDKSWSIAILRYFNPIGSHSSGLIGEDPRGVPNNLLPYVSQVAIGKLPKLYVYGADYPTHDGTGIRDFIHVMDLADGHLAALDYINDNKGILTVNLGTGIGYSVLDVVNTFSKISKREIPYEIVPRRDGDVAESYADPSYAFEKLGWKATKNLEDMCKDSWRWQSSNPNGFV